MFTPFDGFTFFPAVMSATLTAYNLLAWPRDRHLADPGRAVSVLIPARDEAAHIGDAARAVLAALRPQDELIVCDDGSTDDTRGILTRLAATDARLRVIDGEPLPEGQIGKPHACQQLSDAARGDLLVFLDADVRLQPDALARLAGLLDHYQAAMVTGLPRQLYGSLGERLVMPFLTITFTSWIPLDAIWRTKAPWIVAAIGQVVAVRRDAYDRIGGFAAVADQVVDDIAIARRAKERGERVVFASLDQSASCRMYDSSKAMWRGFSKNLFEGLGRRWSLLAACITLYVSAFVLPFVRAGVDHALWGEVVWPASAAVVANVVMRLLLAARFGDSLLALLLHPLASLVVVAMALNSARWSLGEGVHWRGRTYRRRGDPQAP